MHRIFFKVAAAFAALSVVIGAMGSHLLKNFLDAAALESVKTAAHYQMIHSIGLFIIGMLFRHYANKKMLFAGIAFISGIFFFSGSIYLMVGLNEMGLELGKTIAYFTPLGGLLFIAGWILIIVAIPQKGGYVKEKES